MAELVPRFSWQLLRQRDFRLYFTGSLVSNLGTWLQNTVQVLLAYQLTHSVFAVGIVASAQFAGMILSPWAPVLADRLGSGCALIGSQCFSAFIAFGMAACYSLKLLDEELLVIGALSLGLAYSLALPVQLALVPTLVKAADRQAAWKMNSVSYNSGRALAPALCVVIVFFSGPSLIFTLNATSFAIFAIVLARLTPRAMPDRTNNKMYQTVPPGIGDETYQPVQDAIGDEMYQPASGGTGGKKQQPIRRARVTDGIRIATIKDRRMLLLLAIVAAVTLADDPILVLSPSLAHTTLHVSSNWAGYFIAALGWGTVLSSLPPSKRYQRNDPSKASHQAAGWLLVLGVSIVVFAAGLSTQVSLLAAFAAGGAVLFTGATVQTLLVPRRQETAASITALWAIAWAGTKPFASLMDGWLASHVGVLPAGLALAGPALLLALGEICIPKSVKHFIKDRTAAFASRRSQADPHGWSVGESDSGGDDAFGI